MHGLQVLFGAADVYAHSSIVSCRGKTMCEDMEVVAHFEQVLVHFE
jgi:cold shock CspA family protein